MQAHRYSSMPQVLLGLLAIGLAFWWLPRCVQAERASLRFEAACYGPSLNDVSRVLALAEEAYAIDRNHYHFWALAAAEASTARLAAQDIGTYGRLSDSARLWCEKALSANPWHPRSRVLWASLLSERDVAEALRYWQTCVEWQYWEPFNHAFHAELLARSGDFVQASNTLERINGRPYYQETRRILDRMAATDSELK